MIREIIDGRLWIGNALEARDLRGLHQRGIQAVVDLAANEVPAQLGRDIIYCRVPLNDGGNAPPLLVAAIRCLVALLEGEFTTLVACSAGMSRSPTIAAAAMAIVTKQSPDDCLMQIVFGQAHDVSPQLWQSVVAALNKIRSA